MIISFETRLRAERRAGELLAEMEKLKGRPQKASQATTLSDYGISRDQSSRWQKLAKVPQPEFEAVAARPSNPQPAKSRAAFDERSGVRLWSLWVG